MKKIFLSMRLADHFIFFHGQVLKKITDKAKQKLNLKLKNNQMTEIKMKKKILRVKRYHCRPVDNRIQRASFKAYSKYDFVPGEKVIGFEDFSTGNIGDFPAGWNTKAAAEIVTLENIPGRWLKVTKPGVFVPGIHRQIPGGFYLRI